MGSNELPIRPTTKEDLQEITITLTSGKTWYGLPTHDPETHLASYAKCLVEGLFRWTLNEDVFGGVSKPQEKKLPVSVDDLKSLSSTEDDIFGSEMQQLLLAANAHVSTLLRA